MAEIEARLEELGIELPDTPAPIANYVPGVRTGKPDIPVRAGTGEPRRRYRAVRQGRARPHH